MENKNITEEQKFEKQQKVMGDKLKLIADLLDNEMLKTAKIEINALKKYLNFEYKCAKNAKKTKNSI